jgi:hypothetical protein
MAELELSVFLAQHNRRTLHPRAGLEADQHVFCHGNLCAYNWDYRMIARSAGSLNTKRGAGVLNDPAD